MNALPPSISCRVAVVLDHCGDASAEIAHTWGARVGALVISRECGSVGDGSPSWRPCPSVALARRGPREDLVGDNRCRFPCAVDWLAVQLEAYLSGADMWAGRVRVAEESATALRWSQRYSAERNPVHGASLGFSATLYTQLGGFGGMRTGEDRDLHQRAVTAGFRIAYDLRAAVTTSSRRKGRAPAGFANVLDEGDQEELRRDRLRAFPCGAFGCLSQVSRSPSEPPVACVLEARSVLFMWSQPLGDHRRVIRVRQSLNPGRVGSAEPPAGAADLPTLETENFACTADGAVPVWDKPQLRGT